MFIKNYYYVKFGIRCLSNTNEKQCIYFFTPGNVLVIFNVLRNCGCFENVAQQGLVLKVSYL